MKKQSALKRALALGMSATMVGATLAGCGGSASSTAATSTETASSATTEAEATTDSDKPFAGTTLTWYTTLNGNVSDNFANLGDTPWAKYVEEQTGITIEFQHPTQGSEAEEFAVMLASGEYPDIIEYTWTTYSGGAGAAINDGVIISLDDYMADATNLSKVMQEHPEIGKMIARAIRENNARLVIIDPVQAFLGADVDMNRANEVRPIFRSLGDIAQATGCAIVLIGHLNKAAGTQSTYRGLGSIDITAAVRSLLFIGKLKDSPTTRVLIHEKSSLAPPGQSLAFSLGDEKGFEWIGAYDITADELLAGTDTAKTESKTAQAQMLILELLADGKRMPSAELEKAVNERGISSRTMRTAKSRIGDRLVTEKDGTAWVCYLRD